MRYLRPIPRRLPPDGMLVLPSDGQGGYGDARMVRHVRLELADGVADDPHRDSARSGRVFVDAVNSRGAFEVPADSRVVVGSLPDMRVLRCRRCCMVRGQNFRIKAVSRHLQNHLSKSGAAESGASSCCTILAPNFAKKKPLTGT